MKKISTIIITVLMAVLLLTSCGKTADTGKTKEANEPTNKKEVSVENSSETSPEAKSTEGTDEDVNGKQCPYCKLTYKGDNVEAYNAHIAACAEADEAKTSSSVCPYCGGTYSLVDHDPGDPDKSMYASHLAQEEWAHREYVMCQFCGEYYKNGTEHTCKNK